MLMDFFHFSDYITIVIFLVKLSFVTVVVVMNNLMKLLNMGRF